MPPTFDEPFLPNDATAEEVRLEIESWKVDDNPRIISSHTALIKEGAITFQFAVCYEIIDEHTGELHHYAIDILNVRRYKRGRVLTDKYRITEVSQLTALYEFLTVVMDGQLGPITQKRVLVPNEEYHRFERLHRNGNIALAESLSSDADDVRNLIAVGGKDLFTRLVRWFSENQREGDVVEQFIELLNVIGDIHGTERERVFEAIRRQNLTKEDLDILSGRKEGLEEFERDIQNAELDEDYWQGFFERNTWIFGYGLDYRFLQILQREAHISDIDLDGRNAVIGDFLAGCSNFTVLVELKKPTTALFKQTQNRADSWKLSSELTDAVSQILAQKANWTLKGERDNFTDEGELIDQETLDPKAILVIGHTSQFAGDDRINTIKRKTFELFRRNLRNVEIVTFDEVLERARFIVKA